MNFCKNCYYCIKTDLDGSYVPPNEWECEKLFTTDLVTGEQAHKLCHIERSRDYTFAECGKEGKLFLVRKDREMETRGPNTRSFGPDDE